MNEYAQKRATVLDIARQRLIKIHKDVDMIADNQEKLREKEHLSEENTKQEETEIPPDFELTDTGLLFNKVEKNGNVTPIPVTKRFIKILGRHSDYYSGENFGLLLEFVDEDLKTKTWAITSTLMGDAKSLETELNYRGCYVYDIKRLIIFLKASHTKTSFIGISSIGWHVINSSRYFILPNLVVGNGIDRKLIKYQSIDSNNPYKTKGKLKDWQENIGKYLTGQSRLIFGVSFALSSFFLHIVGAENGGIHIYGASSKGKSTLLLICSSLFGDPEIYKLSWRTTPNGMERLAVSRHDAALILDESSEFDNEHNKKLASIIYMMMNGFGKSRLNSDSTLKDILSWRCNVISSGENPISQLITDAGERDNEGVAVRMIDLNAIAGEHGVFDFIPEGFKNGHAFSDYLKASAKKYHGTVAIAFLNLLINENPENIKTLLKEIEEEIINNLKGAQGQVMRCIKRFALAACAGELASKILGIEKGEATNAAIACLKVWIKERGGVKDNEAAKLLNKVRDYFATHNAMFKVIGSDEKYEKDNQAGYKEMVGGRWVHYVNSPTFLKMIKGHSRDFATETLFQAEFIIRNENNTGNAKYLMPKKIANDIHKYYYFNGSKWNMEDVEEVTE